MNEASDAGRGDHRARFRTTRWSRIAAARDRESPDAREALASLCGEYWYPLYAFVRRKGYDRAEAEDLVQGFFVRLLEKDDLASVDRRKGRFRSFLLAACTHFLANQADRDRAQKRGGGRLTFSLEFGDGETRYAQEPAHHLTPERLYERRWALTVLDRALEALKSEMIAAGKGQLFATLRPALLGDGGHVPFRQIAAELGIGEDAARSAATRLRRRFRHRLREEVAGTLKDPAEVESEVSNLFEALAD